MRGRTVVVSEPRLSDEIIRDIKEGLDKAHVISIEQSSGTGELDSWYHFNTHHTETIVEVALPKGIELTIKVTS